MNYFIIINGVQQGPFTVAELQERHIASDTLVWAEGMAQWTPAWQVDELKTLFYQRQTTVAPPPPPPLDVVEQEVGQADGPSVTQQPDRQHRRWGWWLVAGICFVLLLFMAINNPPKSKHQEVIREHITSGITKALTNSDDGLLAQNMGMFAQVLVGPVVDGVINEMLVYHNYLLFSTTTIVVRHGQEKTTSYGFLGKVFTADEQEIANAISSKLNLSAERGDYDRMVSADDSDGSDGEALSDDGEDMQQQDGEASADTLTLSKKMSNAIIDHVGAAIKKQLAQNTDSTTSNGVSKLVDDIIGLLKGK